MTENFVKSKEEIALELLQIILSGTIKSARGETVQAREKVDNLPDSLKTKYEWYLNLYSQCLSVVEGCKLKNHEDKL